VYLDAVTDGWVLVLDADERLVDPFGAPGALRERLRAWTEAREHSPHAYALARYEYLGDGQFTELDIVRLWRARSSVRYARSAWHASVMASIERAGGGIDAVPLGIHHVDLLCEGRARWKRARAVERGTRELSREGCSPLLYAYMGLELAALGLLDEARARFAQCAEREPLCAPTAALFTAQVRLAEGDLDACEREARASLHGARVFRGCYHGHVLLAECAARRGQLELALSHALTARSLRWWNASAHLNLCALALSLNRGSPATHFARALRANPWLLDPALDARGDRPTIYGLQRSLLSLVDRPRTLAARCRA
jgi:hypothetical protein